MGKRGRPQPQAKVTREDGLDPLSKGSPPRPQAFTTICCVSLVGSGGPVGSIHVLAILTGAHGLWGGAHGY